jgi:SAM-dependent methyltransferase
MRSTNGSAALARAAYEPLAAHYDDFTRGYVYDSWLDAILRWSRAHGLAGRRVLDAACGTGKSFMPLLRAGYDVTACDVSPAMVTQARLKAGGRARVVVADVRSLTWASEFDLITCLDDAINYLLTQPDLLAALRGMAGALRPGGILVFDTNSLATYRTAFVEQFDSTSGSTQFRWRGESKPDTLPGTVHSAVLEIERDGEMHATRHVQRHWPLEELRSLLTRAGFSHVVFRGQATGGRLAGEPDEERHPKIACLARTPASARAKPSLDDRGSPSRDGGESHDHQDLTRPPTRCAGRYPAER